MGVLDLLARLQSSDSSPHAERTEQADEQAEQAERAISDNFVLLSPPVRSLSDVESSTDGPDVLDGDEDALLQPQSLPACCDGLDGHSGGLLNKQYLVLAERRSRTSLGHCGDEGVGGDLGRARTLPSSSRHFWRHVLPLWGGGRPAARGPRGGGGYLKTFLARYSDASTGSATSSVDTASKAPRRLRTLLARFGVEGAASSAATSPADPAPPSPPPDSPATSDEHVPDDADTKADATQRLNVQRDEDDGAVPNPLCMARARRKWRWRLPPPRLHPSARASSPSPSAASSSDAGAGVDDGFCSAESWSSSSSGEEAESGRSRGGPVLHRTVVGATPLHDAAALGQLDAMRWLLSSTRCHLQDADYDGNNVLHLAARSVPSPRLARLA